MAKLGEVCDILNGYAFKSNQYTTSGVRIIRISNVQKGYIEDKSPVYYPCDDENVKKYELKQNDLLISLTGNVGRTALLEEKFLPAALNQRVSCVRLKEPDKVLKTYLFHLLNSDYFEQQCMKAAEGVAQKNLSPKWLFEYKIPIYSIERQKEISNTLDKIDLLIILRKQQLAKLDELVKARFVEMFGNIIRNDKSWPIHNFSDIASSRLGKMLDAKQQTGKYSYPYLANFNVQWFNFNVDNLNQMDFNEAEQKEFELRDGDLLVCEGGEIGRCAVWHNEIQPCFFQKALHRVRCNRQLVQPDYLAWWFKYNCNHGGFAEIAGAKATIAHLPGIKLKQLQVALPPLSLQNEFAAFVERVDQQKQTVQQSLEKLELMKKALMQEYFG